MLRRAVALVAAVVVVGVIAVPMHAQASTPPDWKQLSPSTSPTSRIYIRNMMAYDASSSQLILFGGLSSGPSNETWEWNGTTWTLLTPATSPPARAGGSLAYDPAVHGLVLFGGAGASSTALQDTWTWNGSTWTQVTTTPTTGTPPGRSGAMLGYDTAHGQLVLFGGATAIFSGYLNDTWTFNGTDWTQVSTSLSGTPSARWASGIANDALAGQLVLFGGQGSGGATNDTWTWSGTDWSLASPSTSPSTRVAPALAYDAALGELILFGGDHNGASQNDTWTWDGTTWAQLVTATTPPRRDTGALAYSSATDQLILFGGETLGTSTPVPNGDTWSLLAAVGTRTTVVGTPNPVVAPGQVTYVGTVTVPSGGATPGNGTLAFSQDGAPIPGCGAVTITNGSGTCQVSYTATQVGRHDIVAVYSGDDSYATSTSDPYTETVTIPVPTSGAGSVVPGSLLIVTGIALNGLAIRRRRATP